MILVTNAPGGLLLRRDTDPPATKPLFVRTDELAALLADILELATELPAAEAWDVYARLVGNEAA